MLLLKRLGQQGLERVRWQVVAPSVNWAAVRGLKETTGIVGLPVDPEARKHLKEKMEAVLQAVQIIPADVLYRKHVEAFVEPRLADVNSEMTDEELETKYGLQLEEHIELYNDELGLIPKMAGGVVVNVEHVGKHENIHVHARPHCRVEALGGARRVHGMGVDVLLRCRRLTLCPPGAGAD